LPLRQVGHGACADYNAAVCPAAAVWIDPLLASAGTPAATIVAVLCLAIGPLIAGVVLVLVGHDRRLEQVPPAE
jgi:hypothetical protein